MAQTKEDVEHGWMLEFHQQIAIRKEFLKKLQNCILCKSPQTLVPWGGELQMMSTMSTMRFTSGATPADLLVASMAAKPISSTYLRRHWWELNGRPLTPWANAQPTELCRLGPNLDTLEQSLRSLLSSDSEPQTDMDDDSDTSCQMTTSNRDHCPKRAKKWDHQKGERGGQQKTNWGKLSLPIFWDLQKDDAIAYDDWCCEVDILIQRGHTEKKIKMVILNKLEGRLKRTAQVANTERDTSDKGSSTRSWMSWRIHSDGLSHTNHLLGNYEVFIRNEERSESLIMNIQRSIIILPSCGRWHGHGRGAS